MSKVPAPVSLVNRYIIDFLGRHQPFSQVEESVLEWFAGQAVLSYFPDGTRILGAMDGIPARYFVIQRGEVHSAPPGAGDTDAGGAAPLTAGESFPLGALIEGRSVVNDYVAKGDTFCLEFEKPTFDVLLAQSPHFAAFCTRRIAHLLQESSRIARASALEEAYARNSMTAILASMLRGPPVTCRVDTPLREALAIMHNRRIGSMIAIDDKDQAKGILTERDVLNRIVLQELPLDIPLAAVMTPDPITIDERASAFDAVLAMAKHAIRHLPVTCGRKVVGVVSERDLFAVQGTGLREVGRAIRRAADLDALCEAAAGVRTLARNLRSQGMAVSQLTQLIVTLNDRLVERTIDFVARDTSTPLPDMCWIALGSEGRMEQTISSDQDNGMIFEPTPGQSVEACRQRWLGFAQKVNSSLEKLGFPLCKGNIMARNPKWCLTLAEWKERFDDWLRNPTPEALLNAAIFFDLRAVHGNIALATELRAWLADEATKRQAFLRMMAANALGTRPPLNIFGEIAVGALIDLKSQCARPFIDAARILSLAAGNTATHTAQRLRLDAVRHGNTLEAEAMIEAFEFIQGLRIARQFLALEDQGPPNELRISTLNELDRRILKEALRQARKLQSRIKVDYAL